MKKEMDVLKEAEVRFIRRQVIAHNTSEYLFDYTKKEAAKTIKRLNQDLERNRIQMKEDAMKEAEMIAREVNEMEEKKRLKLKEIFDERHDEVTQQLVKEVFDYGNR